MHAMRFHGRRDLRLEEVPRPVAGPGEVLVRVTGSLLAQGIVDLNVEGHFADTAVRHPVTERSGAFVLGQQFGGVIEAAGLGVDVARVGEVVGVAPAFGCSECVACRAGRDNHCEQLAYCGLIGADGGMAAYCAVPAACAIEIPDPRFAPFFEALLVGENLIAKARPFIAPGAPVLILGAGPVGLSIASLLAETEGASVVITDLLPNRRARAASLGYRVVEQPTEMFPLVLDCAGTNPDTGGCALKDGIARVAKGGAIFYVGTYLHPSEISSFDLLIREVTLGGSFAYQRRDIVALTKKLPALDLPVTRLVESLTLTAAMSEGLVRAEVDRDDFTVMVVRP